MRIAIVGAGVGGLCLAQGLRGAGIDVAVYERDSAPTARGQGYRLRLDHTGTDALRTCLPADLFALYEMTSNAPYMSRGMVYDHNLDLVYSHADPVAPFDPARASRGVNRLTLRQVLLAGLDQIVHFGHTACGVTGTDSGVRVWFKGGGYAEADALVGADGVTSTVRRSLLPTAQIVDTGLRAIYGQTPLDGYLLERLPAPLFGGSCPVLGPQRRTLALGSFQPLMAPGRAAAELAPYAHLDPMPDYMKWTLVAPVETFTLPSLWEATPERLHAEALAGIAGWNPALVELVERSNVAVTFPLAIRAAGYVPSWPTGRVTLLGDAIHATTPVGGTGANTALRDAALLTTRLRLAGGRAGLLDALAAYEAEMREYGVAAAHASLRAAEKIFRATPMRW